MDHWSEFYKTYNNLECSKFCEFILEYIDTRGVEKVLDAGCGTGRDTYKLGTLYDVTGTDTSSHTPESNERCTFINEDFCTIDKDPYQLIYSRFTFHSITNEQHEVFLKSITKTGTILCIECRSDHDSEEFKEYGTDHYRNYINKDYLLELLQTHGFVVEYIIEQPGLAPYKSEDPICIRLIARRN